MTALLRAELVKLLAQRRLRAVLGLVLLGPPVAAAVLRSQHGLPTDALYGRWVQEIGLAFPLLLLGGVGPWVVPVLASLVAGDVLSSEHAHGTWATLLSRGRSPWQLLLAKAVVAAGAAVVLVVALGASATAAGVVLVGKQPLVGLSGQQIPFSSGLSLVALSWLSTLPVALAVAALALLISAATRSSLLGVGLPPLVAGLLWLVGMLASLGSVRPLLVVPGLAGWHGLLLADQDLAPVLACSLVSLGVAGVLLLAAAALHRRRDWVTA